METHVTVSDPKGPVGDMTWLRRLFLPYLKDPRDVVFIDAAAEITLVVLPMALLIFLLQPYVIAIIAVPYLALPLRGMQVGTRSCCMRSGTGRPSSTWPCTTGSASG